MKSVLISIRPQWCDLIFSDEKTLEVRKSKPKLETPFKCYVYCTAREDSLFEVTTNKELHDGFGIDGEAKDPDKKIFIKIPKRTSWHKIFDYQKVIGEFTVERFVGLRVTDKTYGEHYIVHDNDIAIEDAQRQPNLRTCMTLYELIRYLKTAKDKHGYGWVISNPVLYKEAMDLTDFGVKRPPQSWQYIDREVQP